MYIYIIYNIYIYITYHLLRKPETAIEYMPRPIIFDIFVKFSGRRALPIWSISKKHHKFTHRTSSLCTLHPEPGQNGPGTGYHAKNARYKSHVFGVAFLPGKHAFGHWSRLYTYHTYINFRQIFSQKIISFRHFKKKTLAETNNCIPQDLRNEGPC